MNRMWKEKIKLGLIKDMVNKKTKNKVNILLAIYQQ